MDEREKRARQMARLAHKNLWEFFTKEGSRRWYRHFMEREDPRFLVAAAREGDGDAIELLREYARGARRARLARLNLNVPDELHEFVWEFFIDGKPPAPSGASPKDRGLRNMMLRGLVKMIVEETGLPIYPNTEYRGEKGGPVTVLQVVAQEFRLSDRTIEDIWRGRTAGLEAVRRAAR
jgi:hypothetical protein